MPRKKIPPLVSAAAPSARTDAAKGSFDQLATVITQVHDSYRQRFASTANRFLTHRNWLIGRHIVDYEQSGKDRAEYGERLLRTLSESLVARNVKGMSFTNLNLFRQFYRTYQHIFQQASELPELELLGVVTGIIQKASEQSLETLQPVDSEGVTTDRLSANPGLLVRHFSFSHFVELMRIDDPLRRAFYETEGIKGNWSVPQLKRQIETMLYERTGLSKDKKGVVAAAHTQNVPATIDDMIRDPYILEFTGLPESHLISERDLETALLDHIQSFLLELGNGFCFEARQKRISLDNEHDYIDLVFYHRILRCHVLIDLKVRKFRHGDAGQMNFYLNYYRENVISEGDNPPVGLILCSGRDETRVKYATAGMDNNLFVSKYLTVLPAEEQITRFLRNDRENTVLKLEEEQARYGERSLP